MDNADNLITQSFSDDEESCTDEPPSKKMCTAQTDTVNPWIEDVLLNIFKYLDAQDLFNCEAVCNNWRTVIGSGTWRKLLKRQIGSNRTWLQLWLKLALDETKLQLVDYRNIYRAIDHYVQQLEKNWRTGDYRRKFYRTGDVTDGYFTMGPDFLAYKCNFENKIQFLDRRSMTPTQSFSMPDISIWQFNRDIAVGTSLEDRNIKIFKISTGELVNEISEPDGFSFDKCYFADKTLAAISPSFDEYKLNVWLMESPVDITHSTNWSFPYNCLSTYDFIMDEHYMVFTVKNSGYDRFADFYTTFYFISTDTREFVRSLSVRKSVTYADGLLRFPTRRIRYSYQSILKLLDVATGTFFQDIYLDKGSSDSFAFYFEVCRANSNVIAFLYEADDTSLVNIYDPAAINKTGHFPLTTFSVGIESRQMFMDDNQLICIGQDVDGRCMIMVLDFGFHFTDLLSEEALKLSSHEFQTALPFVCHEISESC